ncbi:hypothetical protein [Robiginitomaculum antarcticum]|uniref:hypothetical protein n=1 Tax=Robiginitomaculum antarcticum TaxID=437507 RepID=UPI00036FECF0|nr:hypothetical protein [Robiginitomaculum antarcticum]
MSENVKAALKLGGIFSTIFFAVVFLGGLISLPIYGITLMEFPSYFLKILIYPPSLLFYFLLIITPLLWALLYDFRNRKNE